MSIREIRQDETASVTDLYLEMCRVLSEADDRGVPYRDPIHRWILRTTESDDAVCLVSEVDGAIIGFLLASVARHPAMPGVVGTLEEVHVRPRQEAEEERKRELVEGGVAWARDRGASPIQTRVGVDSPWADKELSFWKSIGFEHDQALVTRYFAGDERC